jgi:hypothetical protein
MGSDNTNEANQAPPPAFGIRPSSVARWVMKNSFELLNNELRRDFL